MEWRIFGSARWVHLPGAPIPSWLAPWQIPMPTKLSTVDGLFIGVALDANIQPRAREDFRDPLDFFRGARQPVAIRHLQENRMTRYGMVIGLKPEAETTIQRASRHCLARGFGHDPAPATSATTIYLAQSHTVRLISNTTAPILKPIWRGMAA